MMLFRSLSVALLPVELASSMRRSMACLYTSVLICGSFQKYQIYALLE